MKSLKCVLPLRAWFRIVVRRRKKKRWDKGLSNEGESERSKKLKKGKRKSRELGAMLYITFIAETKWNIFEKSVQGLEPFYSFFVYNIIWKLENRYCKDSNVNGLNSVESECTKGRKEIENWKNGMAIKKFFSSLCQLSNSFFLTYLLFRYINLM